MPVIVFPHLARRMSSAYFPSCESRLFLSTTLILTNSADVLSPPGRQKQGLSLWRSFACPITHLLHISADKEPYVTFLQNDHRSAFSVEHENGIVTKRLG